MAPVADETTWSFLHRVAAACGLQATDLTAGWRWVNPARRNGRADGEVLLDAVAQACGTARPLRRKTLPGSFLGTPIPQRAVFLASGAESGPTFLGEDLVAWRTSIVAAAVAAVIYELAMAVTRKITLRLPFLVLYLGRITITRASGGACTASG